MKRINRPVKINRIFSYSIGSSPVYGFFFFPLKFFVVFSLLQPSHNLVICRLLKISLHFSRKLNPRCQNDSAKSKLILILPFSKMCNDVNTMLYSITANDILMLLKLTCHTFNNNQLKVPLLQSV